MRKVAGVVKTLTRVEASTEIQSSVADRPIASPAPYIHLDTRAEGVVVIRFDAASRQVEPKNLVLDLGAILAEMQQAGYKAAVLLSGEESGFVAGAGQEIAEEVIQDFQRAMSESEIPVVAEIGRASCRE